jgi:hypothetical protein
MMFTVIGAGMAGLLAAAMLRNDCAQITEKAPELPNNHSAVLRFRSSVVGDTVGIEFKKVRVMKASHPYLNPVADAVAYSRKTNGTATLRSSITGNGEVSDRWIAPHDFIPRLAAIVDRTTSIKFGKQVTDFVDRGHPIISTMPMGALMDALGYKADVEFRFVDGVNIVLDLPGFDTYFSLYVPDPQYMASRISVTGSRLIIETQNHEIGFIRFNAQAIIENSLKLIGLTPALILKQLTEAEVVQQRYAKILPINEKVRRDFIMWASREHNIYSLGRFATWRPNLLLDDVVHDVRQIQRMVNGTSDAYQHTLKGY